MCFLHWICDTYGRVSVGAEMLLTLHGYAGGFWEERDEEEVEEVDEGQYIVPEQTCCGEKISKHILESSTVFCKIMQKAHLMSYCIIHF